MGNDLKKLTDWANAKDGVILTKPDDQPNWYRVIPYDEVARRLEERRKT